MLSTSLTRRVFILLIRICPRHPRSTGNYQAEGGWLFLMRHYPPTGVSCGRPLCVIRIIRSWDWTEVSLSSESFIAQLQMPSAFRYWLVSRSPVTGSWRVLLTCSRLSSTSQRKYLMLVYSVLKVQFIMRGSMLFITWSLIYISYLSSHYIWELKRKMVNLKSKLF